MSLIKHREQEEAMLEIIDRVKSRRLELDLSFQDLADLTKMSKSTLQRYESGGIKNIPLDKLQVLAQALKVTPEWIMGWEEKQSYINSFYGLGKSRACYYLDDEVAKKAQEIYEDSDTRILLDAKRDLKKEDLDYIIGLVKRLKGDE